MRPSPCFCQKIVYDSLRRLYPDGQKQMHPLRAENDQRMDNLQVELRKHQHTLAVVGLGVIGFGIWSIVKSALYMTLVNPLQGISLADFQNLTGSDREELVGLALTFLFIILFDLIDLRLRWKVGRQAIAISRDEQTANIGFYVRTALVAIVDGAEFVVGVLAMVGIIPSEESLFDRISTLLMDITSVVMLIEMIAATVMIGKLIKRIRTENAD